MKNTKEFAEMPEEEEIDNEVVHQEKCSKVVSFWEQIQLKVGQEKNLQKWRLKMFLIFFQKAVSMVQEAATFIIN